MISYLLKNSDWSALFSFLSPNLLRVVSPLTLLELGREITQNSSDDLFWKETCSDFAKKLTHQKVQLNEEFKENSGSKLSTKLQGEAVLEAFFFQLLSQDVWILDMRSNAFFCKTGGSLVWQPKRYFYAPDKKFINGIRKLYLGFYGNDGELFSSALKELKLESARDSILAQFGQGDQSDVQFRLKAFQATFTQVFASCAESKTKIPKDFIALGLMLLALYENLEQIGFRYNVRAAFLAARKNAKL